MQCVVKVLMSEISRGLVREGKVALVGPTFPTPLQTAHFYAALPDNFPTFLSRLMQRPGVR